MIRPATQADVPALQAIERAAGRWFAEIGMTFVAEDPPPSSDALLSFVRDGRAWVSGDPPVAYLLADIVDGNAHLEQVSVHPDFARRRVGLALLNHLIAWARARGLPAVTLTTFTDVPWNGPYYERLGFHYLRASETTPGLQAIRAAEATHGLDRWPRACMRRDL